MSISTTQKPTTRRIVGMVVGIVIIGLGIALFKQSHLGNDSISALNMRWNSGSGASTSALAPSSTASAWGSS